MPAEHPYYGHSPADGLHVLKGVWVQRSFLRAHCEAIAANLDEALAATAEAAPVRSAEQTYRLRSDEYERLAPADMGVSATKPSGARKPSEERLLESAIWQRWRLGLDGCSVPGLWKGIAAYQIPLFDSAARSKWGHIDLLGLSHSSEPVVIELKKGTAADTPLRALLEAISYAVAVRKAWDEFSAELSSVVTAHLGVETQLNGGKFPVVLLAPYRFWTAWRSDGQLGTSVSEQSWGAFASLTRALGDKGYPVHFASIGGRTPTSAKDCDASSLTISEFDGPPLAPRS